QLKIDFRSQVAIAFLAFLATAALTGVIGNRADAFLVNNLPALLSQEITLRAGWLATVAMLIAGLLLFAIIGYEAALRNASNLNRINDALARNISTLYIPDSSRPEAQKNAKRVTRDLFKTIVKKRPFDTCGIAIYYPDPSGNYLRTWEWYSAPNENSESLGFYIGENSGRNAPIRARGIAGETFIDGETRIVHFQKDGTADNNLYMSFDRGTTSYRSLICVAILSDLDQSSIGVLCLYSREAKTFDSSGVRTIIESIAYRFSFVLLSFA
ncbi:MAG: hypothetical protein AAGJ95_15060, partial [Cyanobacteria bacterium J06554_11]